MIKETDRYISSAVDLQSEHPVEEILVITHRRPPPTAFAPPPPPPATIRDS